MATAQLEGSLRKVFDRARADVGHGDGELLTRYRTLRDQDAFGSLVRRHGPMVLGVCRRVLRDHHAADDAFQATFLVLAKKADAVRPPDRLAPWLYGVACRTAMKARGRAVRRQQVEQQYATEAVTRPTVQDEAADLLPVIDEQLNALPEKYRTPLVLCGVQGLNKAEAAERLGLPEGTVSSRLARAREMLRERLTRRGVVVPVAALAAVLRADALRAAVLPAVADSATATALGTAAIPTTVLALSHEVIRSMTLLKLNVLGAVAVALSLAGGGFGAYALQADDKKPVGEKPAVKPADKDKPGEKPVKPDGDKPKPAAEGDKPKPDGTKPEPRKNRRSLVGQVGVLDATASTVTLLRMGEGGLREDTVTVRADAKVMIDGKEGKLADVAKGVTADLTIATFGKEGSPPIASEVWVDNSKLVWVVKSAEARSLTLLGGGTTSKLPDRVIKLAPDAKVMVGKKEGKATDLQPGDVATVTLNADRTAAIAVSVTPRGAGDVERPAAKPTPKFSGKVASVDATAGTVTLVSKGDAARELVVKLTADAKVTVDGKSAKIGDIAKGATATFTLSSAKDGQPREANEVTVAGLTFTGVIKQLDTTSVTVGGEKNDRVIKLATGGKVMLGEKEGKLADLKAGEKVTVTLTADESAAILIATGGKRPTGDKPKPEKENPEDE